MFPNVSPLRGSRARSPCGTHAGRIRPRSGAGYFVDADAPAEVKDFLRHYLHPLLRPSGLTEQDDMENWNYAHKASRGTIARSTPTTTRWGSAAHAALRGPTVLKLSGTITDVTEANASEHNRGFYTLAPSSWRPTDGGPDGPVSAEAGALARLLLQREIEDFFYGRRRSS